MEKKRYDCFPLVYAMTSSEGKLSSVEECIMNFRVAFPFILIYRWICDRDDKIWRHDSSILANKIRYTYCMYICWVLLYCNKVKINFRDDLIKSINVSNFFFLGRRMEKFYRWHESVILTCVNRIYLFKSALRNCLQRNMWNVRFFLKKMQLKKSRERRKLM